MGILCLGQTKVFSRSMTTLLKSRTTNQARRDLDIVRVKVPEVTYHKLKANYFYRELFLLKNDLPSRNCINKFASWRMRNVWLYEESMRSACWVGEKMVWLSPRGDTHLVLEQFWDEIKSDNFIVIWTYS